MASKEKEKGEKADIEKRIDHHLAMTMPKLTDCSITKRRHSGTYIYIYEKTPVVIATTISALFNGLRTECDV